MIPVLSDFCDHWLVAIAILVLMYNKSMYDLT